MKKVFYLKTTNVLKDDSQKYNLDKIGGLPTHKPPEYPIYYGDSKMGFLMQFYCDHERFPGFKDILCWQIYQDVKMQDEPIIVEVPVGAMLNEEKEGKAIDAIEERIIYYDEGKEDDVMMIDDEINEAYYDSKFGGAVPEEYLDGDLQFIGWISESVCDDFDLNFGDNYLGLFKDINNKLVIELV